MVFKPGQSGNPGGLPRKPSFIAKAAKASTKDMIAVLVSIALDRKAAKRDRINAAKAVLYRGWGSLPGTSKTPPPKEAVDLVTRFGAAIERELLLQNMPGRMASVRAGKKPMPPGTAGEAIFELARQQAQGKRS